MHLLAVSPFLFAYFHLTLNIKEAILQTPAML